MKEDIVESLHLYVEHGIPTGSFLQAVLENNLVEAVGRADMFNSRILPEICSYVYNNLPIECWGSKEKVENWINLKQKEKT